MRESEAIVKEIKESNFTALDNPEFQKLSKELHATLTYERNTPLVNKAVVKK